MELACVIILILLKSSSATSKSGQACYESIVSFGDSLADTGNGLLLSPPNFPSPAAFPPYGNTFFHQPTGRFSDGRLVIDFIAQRLGLQFVKPYIGGVNNGSRSFSKGVNFAVGGATALNNGFSVSLGTQLGWFKHFLTTFPGGRKYLERSLVLMGEIGGNDYNFRIGQGSRDANLETLRSFVPLVVNCIGSSIQELINLGAKTLLVPGNFPIGCVPHYLTQFKASSTVKDYDPKTGCLTWLNEFSSYHNTLLQKELNRIQQLNRKVTIVYADYYNVTMRFYLSPSKFGFGNTVLSACCGGPSAYCGPQAKCCDDPSKFVSWDGIHFTEAAYKWITQGLLDGTYTVPHLRTTCPSVSWTD